MMPDGAVQDQITDTVTDGVLRAGQHSLGRRTDPLPGVRRRNPARAPPRAPRGADLRSLPVGA
jgi:hypothetical protein